MHLYALMTLLRQSLQILSWYLRCASSSAAKSSSRSVSRAPLCSSGSSLKYSSSASTGTGLECRAHLQGSGLWAYQQAVVSRKLYRGLTQWRWPANGV